MLFPLTCQLSVRGLSTTLFLTLSPTSRERILNVQVWLNHLFGVIYLLDVSDVVEILSFLYYYVIVWVDGDPYANAVTFLGTPHKSNKMTEKFRCCVSNWLITSLVNIIGSFVFVSSKWSLKIAFVPITDSIVTSALCPSTPRLTPSHHLLVTYWLTNRNMSPQIIHNMIVFFPGVVAGSVPQAPNSYNHVDNRMGKAYVQTQNNTIIIICSGLGF